MTGSHQGDKSAEAFWRQLSLKEVHQSSCLFVFIGGSSSLTSDCFSSNDLPRRGGRGPGSQANGSFPKGTGRLSEKWPAGYPPPHHRDDTHLGARASRPHAVPWVAAQFPCDVAADRPAGGNRRGPAEAEAGRRCRLFPVEEMGEAAGGFVRAGRPRSRVGFLP